MEHTYDDLIRELVDAHPELQGHETVLRDILITLQQQKPIQPFDESFKDSLKQKVYDIYLGSLPSMTSTPFSSFSKIYYALLGAAAMCIIGGVLVFHFDILQYANQMPPLSQPSQIALEQQSENEGVLDGADHNERIIAFASSVTNLESEAFGKITVSGQAGMGGGGFGGGGVGLEYVAANEEAIEGVEAASSKMDIYPGPIEPYEVIEYDYLFDGELPELPQTMDVYKIENQGVDVARNSRWFSMDSIDLQKLKDLKMQYVTLREDVTNGYMVSLDFTNSSFSISKMQDTFMGYDPGQGVKRADIDEESILASVRSFIDTYAIDLQNVGEPTVIIPDYGPIVAYTEDGVKTDAVAEAPATMAEVKYPFVLSGYVVHEQYGPLFGVSVNYDLIQKNVSGLYGLESYSMERSAYPLIADESLVQEKIQYGGYERPQYSPEAIIKKVSVPVTNPVLVYAHVYIYDEENRTNERYFIPSLKFTIDRESVDTSELGEWFYPWQKEIIVPLVEDAYIN